MNNFEQEVIEKLMITVERISSMESTICALKEKLERMPCDFHEREIRILNATKNWMIGASCAIASVVSLVFTLINK